MKKAFFVILLSIFVMMGAAAPGAQEALTLEEALDIAVKNNPTVEQLDAAVWQSTNAMRQARSAYWPTLDYQFKITGYLDEQLPSFGPSDIGKFTNSLSLNYTVYDSGRGARLSSGRFGLEASRMDYERYLEQLRYSVHSTFLSAYLTKEGLKVAKESEAFFGELRSYADIRFKEGLIPQSDYLTFANSYDSARVTAVQNERDFRLAALALEGLLHVPVEGDLELELEEQEGAIWGGDLEAMIDSARANRKDLRAARARLFAMKSAFKAAGKSRSPVVSVGAAYQIEENAITELDHNDDITQVFAQMNWRLADGRKRTFATLEQEARVQQLEAQVRALEWSVRSDVLIAWYRVEAAREQLGILDGTIRDAEKNLDIIMKRYKEGLITVTSVTDAELNLSRARLNRLSALVSLSVGNNAMKLAIGGGQ